MRRLAIVLGSVVATGVMLALALLLGSWGYSHRALTTHHGRLARLVEQQPTLDQVVQGLEDEGSPLLASPRDETALRQAISVLPRDTQDQIVQKGKGWPIVRVFRSGEALYVLFFDANEILRDFACAMGQDR